MVRINELYDSLKVLHSICQQIWKTQEWPEDWKKSVFIPIPKKDNAKECSNYHTITLFTHTSNLMFKILQASLQQYMHWELPDVQAGFRKGRGTRDQIANIHWIIEKAREFQKNIYFIDYTKAFDCVDHDTLWKILQEMGIVDHLPASWEICMQIKKKQNQTWNNGLVPHWERSTSGLYIVTLLIYLICRAHHTKCRAQWSTSWNQDCREKYQ